MTAQEIKSKLTEKNIIDILEKLGATIYQNDIDIIITDTVCHHGNKPKLYYYKESKSFYCYSECGSLDIFGVVAQNKGYKLPDELPKVINWICIQCNIDNCQYGFGNTEVISDWNFINGFQKSKNKTVINTKELTIYNDSIMNIFQPLYFQDWIKDGISINSMKKYNIEYCTLQQKIIIPHYDITHKLIGIRGRALIEEDVELFGKYTPLMIGDTKYKHPLSLNFYGINHNLQTIKRKQKVMLVEAEKSVLQTDTMFGENNFTLALSGCSLSTYQRDLLIMLGVKEVIICLDKQYDKLDSIEAKKWAEHIKKEFIKPLSPYMSVYVIWDTIDLLDYKMSPCDKGKDILLQLMKSKIYVGSSE